jgi:hypothetical protein
MQDTDGNGIPDYVDAIDAEVQGSGSTAQFQSTTQTLQSQLESDTNANGVQDRLEYDHGSRKI